MSLIDQALRMREQAQSPEEADRVTLTEYAREGTAPPVSHDQEGTASTVPRDREGVRLIPPTELGSGGAHLSPPVPRHPELEARLVTGRPGSVSLEQYRRLAAILHDVQRGRGLKALMVTSALPYEGKTLTVVNLALTLAESYQRRVLVIDADLRKPAAHAMFGLTNHIGLSEALGKEDLELPIRQVSPCLSILTAGHPGPAPLAGLSSPRMGALIERCSSRFDWVILDTPPVGLLPDAQLLARLTGAVVMVIAAGTTPGAAVERAVAEMGPDCIVGTVLNRVEQRRIPDAGYYHQYGGLRGVD